MTKKKLDSGFHFEVLRAIDAGYLDGAEADLEEAETVIDGEEATVSPIVLSSSRGSMEFELSLAKEEDGAWRIVGSDRL